MSTTYQGPWTRDAFRGKVFYGVDFSCRCLVGADFSNTVCKDCDFSDSDLSHANFKNADLYRCNFSRSVLYAVEFDDANLTRARFTGAFTYGWLMNSSANVTYADLLRFSIERKRRSVSFVESAAENVREIAFGSPIDSTNSLCERTYQVAPYRYTFEDLDPQEAALERSQIFNRLKRLYRENQNGEAALYCLYYERHYLTRSYYRYSPLTGGVYREQAFRTVGRTVGAYLAEFLTGYGIRPIRIIRNLALLALMFFLFSVTVVGVSRSSPLAAVRASCAQTSTRQHSGSNNVTTCSSELDAVQLNGTGVLYLVEYSGISMVNPDPARFVTSGIMPLASLLYFVCSAIMLALLFSSVFVRLLSE